MAMTKKKAPRFATPKGVAVYPWLNKPDSKFNAAGEFKTSLMITGEDFDRALKHKLEAFDGKSIRELLDEAADANFETAKEEADRAHKKLVERVDPYSEVLDEDGNGTGDYLIKFKLLHKVTPKNGKPFTQRPALLDSKRKPTTAPIFGGSIIKVIFEINPYVMTDKKGNKVRSIDAGLSLRMKAVQVIELSAGQNAYDDMLDEEEGFEDDGSGVDEFDNDTGDDATDGVEANADKDDDDF